MTHRSSLISKLSTLDAAQRIFFIVVALGIRESLALLNNPSSEIVGAYVFNLWRWLTGFGYLTTALRFSHGVSLLYGHETERVKNSMLPSPSRVFWLAAFMLTLSILLYLMAANILNARGYLLFTILMLIVDLLYILASGVVRGI